MQTQLGRAEQEVEGHGALRGVPLLLKSSLVIDGHPRPHPCLPLEVLSCLVPVALCPHTPFSRLALSVECPLAEMATLSSQAWGFESLPPTTAV